MATAAAPKLPSASLPSPTPLCGRKRPSTLLSLRRPIAYQITTTYSRPRVCQGTKCKASEVSTEVGNWVPVVPVSALPRGERRVIVQEGEAILLLWYKNDVFAIENRSPAEGAYSEGLLNAKLTQDGCIVCPTTDSTFDLSNDQNIYIDMGEGASSEASAEIVFSGRAQPGSTASNVNVEEVKMVIDEGSEAFGFTGRNELINGKAAIIGFLLLLDFELLTGKGLLKGTGFLDFLYSVSNAF